MSPQSGRERIYLLMTIGTLVIGGSVLIGIIYGAAALLTALPFLLIGGLLIAALWFLIATVSNWRARSEREYHDAARRHLAETSKRGRKDGKDGSSR